MDRSRDGPEDHFRQFFEQAAVGMAMIDPATKCILRANASYGQIVGHTPEELQGVSFLALTHPDDREADAALHEQVVRGDREIYWTEKRYVHKSGQPVWVQVTATVFRDAAGIPQYTITIAQDITARRQTEDALRQSEATLRTILDTLPVGVWIAGRSGGIVQVNGSAGEIWGSAEAAIHYQRHRAWWADSDDPVQPSDWPMVRAFGEGWTSLDDVLTIEVPGGTRKTVLHSARPLHDGDGSIIGAVGVMQDITSLKQAEQEAQRAAQGREELLSIVSHDLKNPLSVILMNAEYLLRILPADDRRARARADSIRQTTLRMNRLVGDLLNISRIQAGRLGISPEPLNVRALIHDAIESQEQLADEKGLHLGSQIHCRLPPVLADKGRILQVFANLIGNAIKFTPAGGNVTVTAGRQGDMVVLAVEDTGPGIPAEQIPQLFQRFWQPQQSRKQGTGLGLAIAQGIVEAHGGKIWIESTVGSGTKLAFTLPLAIPTAKSSPAPEVDELSA